eukprot:TRINITY_DN80825_c0_g1_i1.p1 TRINITY_DN80825_c0_g1~~TRINITY_DN80825_c0_g1_i1.p1  ORF type:complete len:514 (-),score=82.65 TRINITY_DN80825_c0_g1_i1:55-1596(-)
MRRGPLRSASPAPRTQDAAAPAGVTDRGTRGEVWRAVALQSHLLGIGQVKPPGARGRGGSLGAATGRGRSSGPSGRGEQATRSSSYGGRSAARVPAADASPTAAAGRGLDELADLEYDEKLRRHKASQTLAQRMGLVAGAAAPLTADQWDAVKKASDSREDSDAPCSICLDDFRERRQVILSCSHVFHQECLRSFEAFSGHRKCPLCRGQSYDATPHFSGFTVWRKKCASRIQRAWRGYKSRLDVFEQMRDPEVRAQVPSLHRKACGRALNVASSKLQKVCEQREDALDRFLEELDSSVAACSEQLREGLLGFQQLHPDASPSGLEAAAMAPSAVAAAAASSEGGSPATAPGSSQSQKSESVVAEADKWAKARRAALDRGEGDVIDCPICFQDCHLRGPEAARVELLSCSHVFHRCCLVSFESFHVFETHVCPVCRQTYERRPWQQPTARQAASVGQPAAAASIDGLPPKPPGGQFAAPRPRPPRAAARQGASRQAQPAERRRGAGSVMGYLS